MQGKDNLKKYNDEQFMWGIGKDVERFDVKVTAEQIKLLNLFGPLDASDLSGYMYRAFRDILFYSETAICADTKRSLFYLLELVEILDEIHSTREKKGANIVATVVTEK